jgi:hypothetical protein
MKNGDLRAYPCNQTWQLNMEKSSNESRDFPAAMFDDIGGSVTSKINVATSWDVK